MSVFPVHIDVVINDVGSPKRVGVVIVAQVDQVVLLVETHDDTVLQRRRVHQDLAGWDVMVCGDALYEVHEQLGLGKLIAQSEELLGLDTQQHEGENKEAHPGVTPTGPRSVTQVENTENESNQKQDDDRRTRRVESAL